VLQQAAAVGMGAMPGLAGEGPRGLLVETKPPLGVATGGAGLVEVKPPLGTGSATAVALQGVNAAAPLGVLPGSNIAPASVGIPTIGNRLGGDEVGLGAAGVNPAAAGTAPAAAGSGMVPTVYSMPILAAPTLPETALPVSGMPGSGMGLHQTLTTSLPLTSQSVLQSSLTTAPVSNCWRFLAM
jgi:hypothetical protein